MTSALSSYGEVVGSEVLEELQILAEHVGDRVLQNINANPSGGAIAEILTRILPLLGELGVSTRWDLMPVTPGFLAVTKAFHNALHGRHDAIVKEMFDVFEAQTDAALRSMDLSGDVIFVHDPQPVGLIKGRANDARAWMWRCYIDISSPEQRVWSFLKPYIERYDCSVFSMPDFAKELPTPQYMIAPSIDPLSQKHQELDPGYVRQILEQYGIDPKRPILTQISRFDRLKDPLGVIATYRMVKKRFNVQLVLAGGGAPEDPEGEVVLSEVYEYAANDPDIHVIPLPPASDLTINALVRGSTVVLQKSIREGFGLTVSEALWKRKPVVGSAVGGIKSQIVDEVTVYLVHSPEGAANRVVQLLADQDLCRIMGENGRRLVKHNFLITRHVKDYLLLMLAIDHPDEDIIYLREPRAATESSA